jgi:hypothetical protein
MYIEHPSEELLVLCRERPYQGADPTVCKFLFVGQDANYHPDLAFLPVFEHVLAYHRNGVQFWVEQGVHHPFLLPSYRGDGRRYHLNFSKIGFLPEHASLVSFVELLDRPTVGRSRLDAIDLQKSHLRWLNAVMMDGAAEHVFLSAAVIRLMVSTGQFPWLSKTTATELPLAKVYSRPGKTMYRHLHFSNYGKFQKQLEQERWAIAALI